MPNARQLRRDALWKVERARPASLSEGLMFYCCPLAVDPLLSPNFHQRESDASSKSLWAETLWRPVRHFIPVRPHTYRSQAAPPSPLRARWNGQSGSSWAS